MSEPIFELREGNGRYYHAIITGVLGSETIAKGLGVPLHMVAAADFWGMVWSDEHNKVFKGRFKFKSGRKMVIDKKFDFNASLADVMIPIKEMELADLKIYHCETGSIDDVLNIMKQNELIDWMKVVSK